MLPELATAGLHALAQPPLHQLLRQVRAFDLPSSAPEPAKQAAPPAGNDLLEEMLRLL